MNKEVRSYLSEIGRKGGKKSRRRLTPEQARRMVAVREARKAYDEHHTECFWSYNRDAMIGLEAVPWVAQTLMNEGNRIAFEKARKIKRLLRGTNRCQ